MTVDDIATRLAELAAEVRVLRAESEARRLLGRYMMLCDSPVPVPGMSDAQRCQAISELFAPDAVWEGVGETHGAQFGTKVGAAAIAEHMAEFYGGRHPRQIFNTHYLCSERLTATVDTAEGTWVQFQPWIYDDGTSVLRSSRLHVRFRDADGGWRIAHYRTENLFVADLPGAWPTSVISRPLLLASTSS